MLLTLNSINFENNFQTIKEIYQEMISSGVSIYSISLNQKFIGIFGASASIITGEKIFILEYLIVEKNMRNNNISGEIIDSIIKLAKEEEVDKMHLFMGDDNSWIINPLLNRNFDCQKISFSKKLPTKESFFDIKVMINDVIEENYIMDVMFLKDEEIKSEIIEDEEEMDQLMQEGWHPRSVDISVYVIKNNHKELVEGSNSVMRWDEITYNISGDFNAVRS